MYDAVKITDNLYITCEKLSLIYNSSKPFIIKTVLANRFFSYNFSTKLKYLLVIIRVRS